MRDGQGEDFDGVLAATGFESRNLFDITPTTGAVLYLSDAPCTVDAQAYEPAVRDPGELRFSQGGNTDGVRIALENASGAYGTTDEDGVSPLAGAAVTVRYAVSVPGAGAWEVDVLGYGRLTDVEFDGELVRCTVVADTNDPEALVSGETATLEELTPAQALRSDRTRPNGWGDGGYFDYYRDRRLDRDYRGELI